MRHYTVNFAGCCFRVPVVSVISRKCLWPWATFEGHFSYCKPILCTSRFYAVCCCCYRCCFKL